LTPSGGKDHEETHATPQQQRPICETQQSEAPEMSKGIIPSPPELVRESIIVVGGAILAAVIFQALPGLRAWIAERMPNK
jgi:hypothetical protein